MVKRIFIIILALIVSACGAYYSKDIYLEDAGSKGWKPAFGDARISRYSCGDQEILLVPTTISSKRSSKAAFGVPYWPSKVSAPTASKDNLSFGFQYNTGKSHKCSKNDIVLIYQSNRYLPSKYVQVSLAFCRYEFDIKPEALTSINLEFSPSILGCNVNSLLLKKDEGYNYNFQPF